METVLRRTFSYRLRAVFLNREGTCLREKLHANNAPGAPSAY